MWFLLCSDKCAPRISSSRRIGGRGGGEGEIPAPFPISNPNFQPKDLAALPPPMDLCHPLFPFIFFFLLLAVPTSATQEPTIYDHLRRYGLPIGLFPKGITRYSLNPSDGSFLLNLPQPCNAKFENEVHYDFNVSGVLQFGQIADLSGVSAQELFLWFPVKRISVDVPSSGLIYFDVGVVNKQFSLSLFECPPDCSAASVVDHPLLDHDLKAAS